MYKTKVCFDCGKRKDMDKFTPHRKKANGETVYRRICRGCYKVYNRKKYEKNREEILKKAKEYSEKNRERLAEWQRENRRVNSEHVKKRDMAWYYKNKDRIRKQRKLAYRKNKDHILALDKIYREKNREAIRERRKKRWANRTKKQVALQKQRAQDWREENRDCLLANSAKRKANKKQRTPSWITSEDYANIRKFYAQREKRRASSGEEWHVDHIVPLYGVDENGKRNVSGLHVPWNLRVIKATTNLQKQNFFFGKWIHPCVRTT